MLTLSPEQIEEIADMLTTGLRCFWHKEKAELLSIPDETKYNGIYSELWEEQIEELENNFSDYIEIEQLTSRDSFRIMEDFIDTLPDSNKLKNQLINSLNRKKPFREFKFVIDNSGEYRQKWFDFRDQAYFDWVKKEIDLFNQREND